MVLKSKSRNDFLFFFFFWQVGVFDLLLPKPLLLCLASFGFFLNGNFSWFFMEKRE